MPGLCANGHEVDPGNRFCTYCGLAMQARCANGHEVHPGNRFCTECGVRMPGRCANGHEVAAGNRFCTQCGLSMPAVCPNGHDVDAAHLFCTQCGEPMSGLCPNGHVVQPAQRYCTVCGIGLLGLAPGPLALPRGPDPEPPPGEIDVSTHDAWPTGTPQAQTIGPSGWHRPGSASARRRLSRRAARRSMTMVATGIANLLVVGAAGRRRWRSSGRSGSPPAVSAPRDPGQRAARHS
jgi:hypothetical protein